MYTFTIILLSSSDCFIKCQILMALFLFLLPQPTFPVDVLQPVLNMEMFFFVCFLFVIFEKDRLWFSFSLNAMRKHSSSGFWFNILFVCLYVCDIFSLSWEHCNSCYVQSKWRRWFDSPWCVQHYDISICRRIRNKLKGINLCCAIQ